jgi:hypothetical protein
MRKKYLKWISAEVDQALPEKKRQKLQQVIGHDPEGQKRLAAWRLWRSFPRQTPDYPVSPFFVSRVMARYRAATNTVMSVFDWLLRPSMQLAFFVCLLGLLMHFLARPAVYYYNSAAVDAKILLQDTEAQQTLSTDDQTLQFALNGGQAPAGKGGHK